MSIAAAHEIEARARSKQDTNNNKSMLYTTEDTVDTVNAKPANLFQKHAWYFCLEGHQYSHSTVCMSPEWWIRPCCPVCQESQLKSEKKGTDKSHCIN